MLYRLRLLFFAVVTLAVAYVFSLIYLTAVSFYPGTGSIRPYGPTGRPVQATVEECRRIGPVSTHGLGYWWVCRIIVEREGEKSLEAVVGHSIVGPGQIGKVVTLNEACRDPDRTECGYGKPVSRIFELLYGILGMLGRAFGFVLLFMVALYLFRAVVGAPTYFLLVDKWREMKDGPGVKRVGATVTARQGKDMTLSGRNEIDSLLRQLDDPVHLERPAGFDYAAEQARFAALVAAVEARLGCVCTVDAGMNVQDASYLGQFEIPASATATETEIFVRVSNFGGLALLGAERPGVYDDEETRILIAYADWRKVLEVLTNHGYVVLLEDALSRPYDGTSDALRHACPTYPATWFARYFDHL
ncbi:DUF6346 domain-containing protein [Solwaraspora sp. WMMD792]|uniref:DUF6346 domain-containing protein n=1 Tax=Solwaraspora sp. WMMD792 TaxID=3016099 RepID=UPI0024168B68|nr:DUF6346 domain-containing protein [Solwaraspora sp. WMMD792]MDG4771567.1 DUF6346 domain-containing protein [Solwaraspora sp. WMMD792]